MLAERHHLDELRMRFKNEQYVLQCLTLGKKSQNLAKLLATYKTLGDNCPKKSHFVFEAPNGTIERLWKDKALWRQTDKTLLARWVARQCHGLVEALAQFHKFQGVDGDEEPKARGMHGDIKPDTTSTCTRTGMWAGSPSGYCRSRILSSTASTPRGPSST
ncbi:hypothetical protein VUR80DRAFT_4153 [Thermomyces stellatus]